MIILCTDDEDPRVAPSLLPLPGNADLGPAGTVIAQEASPNEIGAGDSVVIDAGTIASELTVDSVREGDRIRPLGMTGRRKLSDMLSEAKIPRRSRPSVPVVRDGDEIVWVAGVQMSDVYKVTEGTRRAFRLTWNRPHEEETVRQDSNGG